MGNLSRNLLLQANDPAPSWRWRAWLPSLGGGIGLPSFLDGGTSGLLVEKVTVPGHTIPEIERYAAGTYIKYPDFHNVASADIVVYEDILFTATRYFESWQRMVADSGTGVYGPPALYRKTIPVHYYDYVDDTTPRMQIDLCYCWPSETNSFDMGYAESGALTVSVKMSVSRIRRSF